jgi:hypothetical protein
MEFNLEKCKVMHIGCRNPNTNYNFLGSTLISSNQETDLGIIITNDLKVTKYIMYKCRKESNENAGIH